MARTSKESPKDDDLPLRTCSSLPYKQVGDQNMLSSKPTLEETPTVDNDNVSFNEIDSVDGTQEWLVQNLCGGPANFFPGESRNDTDDFTGMDTNWCGLFTKEEELRETEDEKHLDDSGLDTASAGTVSTIGKMFRDLVSLPSDPELENDVDKFSVGGLSGLSGQELDIAPSSEDLLLLQNDRINIEEEIRNIDVDEVIGAQNMVLEGGVERERSDASCKKASVASRQKSLLKELNLSMEKYGRHDVRCANIRVALADVFDEDEEFDQALQAYREAAMVYITKLGDHHETTLQTKVCVGKMLEKTGDCNEAIDILYNVLLMRQALLGERHMFVSDVLAIISRVLDKKGNSSRAIKEMKRALKMYRESLGDSHPVVATTVDEIADLYMKNEDPQKASAILEEVVKLRAATLGHNHPDVAWSLMKLATAQESSGNYSKAMKSLKKSYVIFEDAENERSPNALLAVERIAMNYKATNETEKAVAAYVGVVRGRKQTFGEHHPKVAQGYLQLGILLKDAGENKRAMKCMNHALALCVAEGNDMRDDERTAETMHEIALLHAIMGKPSEARKFFKQEISIRQQMGPSELPQTAKSLNCLGVFEYNEKNHARALNCFMEALAAFEKTEGHAIDFGEALFNAGLALKARGHRQRASEAFVESFNIFKNHGLKDDHPLFVKAAAEVSLMKNQCQCSKENCRQRPCKSLNMATF